MENELKQIKPSEIMLGNFFYSMGSVEMCMEIVMIGEQDWSVGHKGWGKKDSPMPDGVQYSPTPIPLTQEWKECFVIEKYEGIPERIKFVHEVQNYFTVVFGINLLEIMNWDKLPKK